MENKYFKITDSIYDICNAYPETLDVFTANGFSQFKNPKMLEQMGKSVTLQMALKMKKLNAAAFVHLLNESIESKRNSVDIDLKTKTAAGDAAVKVQGLLPCPVRVPLQESFDAFITDFEKEHQQKVECDLKAASMGLDWLIDDVVNHDDASNLADIFISAGFDLFFDEKLMGKFKKQQIFKDSTGFQKLNRNFDNEEICLKDPDGHYSMIGVVPAVFLVNTKELGGRAVPRTWADLFQPEFKNSVSLPISDFDLFNSMLLHIYKTYGEEGVKGLGACLLSSMHPSQMVKSHQQKQQRPAVTIMPYFFTKMVKQGGDMAAVWPEDGAIISPIFMLTKKESLERSQPIIDFFASEKVAEILSHQGLFPSVNPNIDNRLPEENKFMWLGWDYINNNDIGALIKKCGQLFNGAVKQQELSGFRMVK